MEGGIGRWKLLQRIAMSSQATSWRAVGPQGEPALIKVFDRTQLTGIDLPSLERLATIRHPNVAEIIEHGRDTKGHLYVATRFIEGTTLERQLGEQGRLHEALVRDLGVAVARALRAVHQLGLVHRDVKPSNIVVPASGDYTQAVLVDLDLVGERRPDTGTTQELVVVGSPAYFAPEQIMGQGLTHQADLWALGVVLFECAVGKRPFERESIVALFQAMMSEDPDLSSVPGGLHRPIQWALTRALSARVPDALTLERELLSAVVKRKVVLQGPALEAPTRAPSRPAVARSHAAPASSIPALTRSQGAPSRARKHAAPAVAMALVVALLAVALIALGRLGLVSRASLIALAMVAASAAVAGFLIRRLYSSSEASNTVKVRGDLEQKQSVTASIALTVQQLGEQYRADPRARLLTESMALVLQHCDSLDELEPQERVKVTLQILDAFMRLEARISEASQPWYQRHEKAVTWIGALGTACAAWWGLGEGVMKVAGGAPPAGLVRGCPVGEVIPSTRIRLEAVDGAPLSWSLGGKPLLVATTFNWPDDAKLTSSPGTYPIYIQRDADDASGAWCVIQVQ